MLKLRSIGIRDYSVLEGEQRIGRIRLAAERNPVYLALGRLSRLTRRLFSLG